MSKVSDALKRLNDILPLQDGLKSLSDDDAALYCKLLNSYVERGSTLTRDEVAELVDDAEQSLYNVVASKLIVLDEAGNPSGAYPFTSEEREHKVRINGVTTHCMCALDALAVSPMFDTTTEIDSLCRVTGEAIPQVALLRWLRLCCWLQFKHRLPVDAFMQASQAIS